MPMATKSSQEIKAAKIKGEIEQVTGITFSGDLGEQLASAVNDAILTGARKVNAADEDSPIECCAEWHFARFRGTGKNLVPLLYGISFHLAKESGAFYLSMNKVAKYLGLDRDDLYPAANLLVASGFWQKIESEIGKAVKYRPVGHKEWAQLHQGRCTKKLEMGFTQDDEELALLGRNLHAIFGGEKFFPEVLKGYRRDAAFGNAAGIALSDDEICQQAKKFFALDKGKGGGKERRKRFAQYLRDYARQINEIA